jgi:alpha-beta hydrolase superfamily lysophospholipase
MTSPIENKEEFFLATSDGEEIFIREWSSKIASSPSVVLMHGLGEHCGRYLHIAEFFISLGFSVRSFDQRGHGKSSGTRGDIPDTDAILRDTRFVIDEFSKKAGAPPLIFAHSMGGLFACHLALEGILPISGLILSSPALAVNISAFQSWLFKLSSVLIPHIGVAHGTNGIYLSHDSEVIKAYQNDDLVHSRISAGLYQSMLNSMAYVKEHAQQLRVPLLLLIADADVVVDPKGSIDFSAQLSAHSMQMNVTTRHYPGFYHEIFNELDAVIAFDDVRNWLEQQNFMPVIVDPLTLNT